MPYTLDDHEELARLVWKDFPIKEFMENELRNIEDSLKLYQHLYGERPLLPWYKRLWNRLRYNKLTYWPGEIIWRIRYGRQFYEER